MGNLTEVYCKIYFPISEDIEWGNFGEDSLSIFKWDEDSDHWWQINWFSDFDQVLTESSAAPLQPGVYRVSGNPSGDTTNKPTKYYEDGTYE